MLTLLLDINISKLIIFDALKIIHLLKIGCIICKIINRNSRTINQSIRFRRKAAQNIDYFFTKIW